MILTFVRSQRLATGSNREGAAAPPSWLFLLPTLEELRPCAFGSPGADLLRGLGSLEAIRPLGDTAPPPDCGLVIVGRDTPDAAVARLGAAARDLPVWVEAAADGAALRVLGAGAPQWLLAAGTRRADEGPRHAGDGSGGLRAALRLPSPRAGTHSGERLRRVAGRVLRKLGVGRESVARAVAYARPLHPGGPPFAETPSEGTLVLPAGSPAGPPAWLLRAARDAGRDVTGAAWAILPPRGYRSQKVLLLVDRGDDPMAVKITQDPAFNARLLNEHRALAALEGTAALPPGAVPRACFQARHRDLAVVGETALDGVPFPTRSTGAADCPIAARAMESLARLATSTARAATGADHAAALAEIVGRLREIYRLDDPVCRAVDESLETLARAPRVPAVFLHGDPGEWNLLVAPDGEIGFLDWENAEPEGPPLWDLFAFLLGYTRFALERAGVRPTPSTLIARLLAPRSPFAERFVDRMLDLARQLDLSREAIVPLLILYCATTAVREAWRLAPENPDRGHGIRSLREVAGRRESSPVLARLGAEG